MKGGGPGFSSMSPERKRNVNKINDDQGSGIQQTKSLYNIIFYTKSTCFTMYSAELLVLFEWYNCPDHFFRATRFLFLVFPYFSFLCRALD